MLYVLAIVDIVINEYNEVFIPLASRPSLKAIELIIVTKIPIISADCLGNKSLLTCSTLKMLPPSKIIPIEYFFEKS